MNEYNGVLVNDTKQCTMIILLKHHGIFPETGHVLGSKEKRKLIKYWQHRLRHHTQKNFILKEKLLVGGSFSSPPVEVTKGSFKMSWQILSSAMFAFKLVYISFELLLEISVDCSTCLATIIQLVITIHVSSSTSENW